MSNSGRLRSVPPAPASERTGVVMAAPPLAARGASRRLVQALALLVGAGSWGCSDSATNPLPSAPTDVVVATGQVPASVKWVEVTKGAIGRITMSQNASWRVMAYVTLAQHVAAEREAESLDGIVASSRGAIAGASAAVLAYLFPADIPSFESLVAAEGDSLPSEERAAYLAGVALGRGVGAKAVARARDDRFGAVWTGSVPTGPGLWFSSSAPPLPPLLPLMGEMRPFHMKSGRQFRPGPPPAFGSPAFLQAVAEVRGFSDTRTPVQDSLAKYWAAPTGSLTAGLWNTIIAEHILRAQLDERAAARTLALVNTAGTDGLIACHDAKYQYWLLRPSQADPGINLAIGLPNHPSYPSNHSCISGAVAYVMGDLFPAERARYSALAVEASMSRLYGGIHYRFDMDSGLGIGRKVSRLVRDNERQRALAGMLR